MSCVVRTHAPTLCAAIGMQNTVVLQAAACGIVCNGNLQHSAMMFFSVLQWCSTFCIIVLFAYLLLDYHDLVVALL